MNERYIIDRVEGNYVIIEKENGDMCKITTDKINGKFTEGDALISVGKYFEIDKNLTLNRKKEIEDKVNDMWEE